MSILSVFNLLYSLLCIIGGSFLSQSVTFESLESKNSRGEEVFNKISLSSADNRDIWKMKQSHNGPSAHVWDEIQIIVDKSQSPYQASFHQIKDGAEVEYKTDCFRCHTGGPRLIRPNIQSELAPLTLPQQLTVAKWNLLIKSYGDVRIKENNPFVRKVPIVADQLAAHTILQVESCTKCHREGGIRSPLTQAHRETIRFLIKGHQMPPWPHEISASDKKELNKFIYGL